MQLPFKYHQNLYLNKPVHLKMSVYQKLITLSIIYCPYIQSVIDHRKHSHMILWERSRRFPLKGNNEMSDVDPNQTEAIQDYNVLSYSPMIIVVLAKQFRERYITLYAAISM